MRWDFVVPIIQNVHLFHHQCTISEDVYKIHSELFVQKVHHKIFLNKIQEEQDIPLIGLWPLNVWFLNLRYNMMYSNCN